MQDQGRDFRMGETYACAQTVGKQALVRDDLKSQEREDNRRQMFKANCFFCGHFHDLKESKKKKERKTIAKRLGMIRKRNISSSEKGGELHKGVFECVCS